MAESEAFSPISPSRVTAALLFACAAVAGLLSGMHAARGLNSSLTSKLTGFAFYASAGYWFSKKGRARGTEWVWDLGLVLYAVWPAVIPYYLLKTRALRKSLLIFLVIAAVWILGLVAGHLLGLVR
jgi:hypothetical protein